MSQLNIYGFIMGHETYNGWNSGPNSAGGVSLKISFQNPSDTKTIKYARLTFRAKNAVGDEAPCSIRHSAVKTGVVTGPIAPNAHYQQAFFENMWYNYSISTVNIIRAELEYMDGTFETITDFVSNPPAGAGCYVATCVYGSYDCPEVWTLRRYRDNTLDTTWYGKLFIKTYYAVSPTVVKLFGNTKWFKSFWKTKLDRMVKKLQENGVEDTPYDDKDFS